MGNLDQAPALKLAPTGAKGLMSENKTDARSGDSLRKKHFFAPGYSPVVVCAQPSRQLMIHHGLMIHPDS